jgi:hypothetical protein
MKPACLIVLALLLMPGPAFAQASGPGVNVLNNPTVVQGTPAASSAGWPVRPALPAQVTATSIAGLAGAAVSASLAATAGKTNYVGGFSVTCTNPASAVNGVVTVTDGATAIQNYELEESVTGQILLAPPFAAAIPSSTTNQAITVSVPAITGGGTCAVNLWGWRE